MKKKIVAIVLAVVLMFSCLVPAFAEDDKKSGFDIQALLNDPFVQTIITEVMDMNETWELVGQVMDIVAKVKDKDALKQQISSMTSAQLAEFAKLLVKQLNSLLKKITDEDNKIMIQYTIDKFMSIAKNLIGSDKQGDYTTTLPDRSETWNETAMGDINGDGRINAYDARMVLRRSAELISFTPEQDKLADVDMDGIVTAKDARLILRVGAELITMDEVLGRR